MSARLKGSPPGRNVKTLSKDPESSSSGVYPASSWKYIAIYYAIAYGISWILWSPLILGEEGLKWFHVAPPLPVVISVGTLGPLMACYMTHRLLTGNWRAVRLLPRDKSRLFWLALGPMLVMFCFFVIVPALISKGPPNTWRWHPGCVAGILVPMFNYNLLGGPLFEEFGWRGFLQPRLQQALPPWIAAVIVGVGWAAWHLPLFLVRGWSSSASPPVFFLILVGLSMVMAFAFNASDKAVSVAILMHSAFNSSPRFMEGYLRGVSTREIPWPELLLAVSFLLMGVVLTVATCGRLAANGDSPLGV